MSTLPLKAHIAVPRGERGMALITGLLLLLVVTIIGLSMFRSFGMQEKIAGNTREKDRALNAAISAQQYAEAWLLSGNAPTQGGACASPVISSAIGEVCTNQPDNGFTAAPWAIGGSPAGVRFDNFASQNVTGAAATAGSYYQAPQYYVTWLAGVPHGVTYYQIDAAGWGGAANSVAVVESTYEVFPPGVGSGGGSSGGLSGGSLDK